MVSDIGGPPKVVRDLDASLIVAAGNPDASLSAWPQPWWAGRVPDADACHRYAETFSWQRGPRTPPHPLEALCEVGAVR